MEGPGHDTYRRVTPCRVAVVDAAGPLDGSQSSSQFGGGLAGEGEHDHVPRIGEAGEASMSDPSGQHAGLARSGSGDHRQERGGGDHGLTLGAVETEEQFVVLGLAHRPIVGLADRRVGGK